jgi:hypothetical protein
MSVYTRCALKLNTTMMRTVAVFWLFVLFRGYCVGQVLPASSGTCSVSPSGLERCEWTGGVQNSKMFVTRYVLSPGAPLHTPVEGRDAVIVGMNNGELVNEKKSAPNHVAISKDSVMWMPKEEPYLLRNSGKENLELLLIEIRESPSR